MTLWFNCYPKKVGIFYETHDSVTKRELHLNHKLSANKRQIIVFHYPVTKSSLIFLISFVSAIKNINNINCCLIYAYFDKCLS